MNISVIIPSYKNLTLFKNAIGSVLKQTEPPMEIIVSDDTPTDEIENYCKELSDKRIKYFRNQSSLGAVSNWNAGIKRASGDWFIILHHDEEFLDEDYLERLSKYEGNRDLVISDIRVRERKTIRKGRINGIFKRLILKNPMSLLIINCVGPCACIAFHRSILCDFDPNLVWLVDVEWYYRLFKSSQSVVYDPSLLILSNHGHKDQITNNIDVQTKNEEDFKYIISKYKGKKVVKIARFLSKVLAKIRALR